MLRAASEGEHEVEDLIDLTEANEYSSIIVNKRMDEEEVASASSSPYKRRRPLQHPKQSTAVAIARSKGDEPIILIDSSSDSEDNVRRRRAESRALWMAGSSSSAARGGIIDLTSPASSVCKDGDSSLKDDGKGPNTPSHQSTRRRRRSGGMGRRSSDSMVVLLLDDDDEEEEKDSPPARPVRVRMAKRQSGGGGEGSLLSDEILEIDDDDDEEKGERQMEDGKVALHLFDEEDDDGDVLAALADGEEEEDEEQSEAVSSLASSNRSSGSGSVISSSSCSSSSGVHSRGGGGGLGLRSVAKGEEKEQEVDNGLEQLKTTELRAQLRLMGVTSRSQRKADMLALLRQTLRSKRLAPFPSESTDRFSDTRGKVIKANLPHGPNGHALCRLCGEECPKKANTFCSKACVHQHRLRSDASYVRKCLLVRDRGICKVCGLNAQALYLKVRRECHGGNRRGGGSKDEMKIMQATVNSVLEGTKLEGKVRLRGLAARQEGRTLKGRPRKPLGSGLFWHADHIVAVIEGGGLQGLENFRTLCVACHHEITKEMLQGRRRQQQQQSDQAVAKTGGGAFACAAAAAGEGVALAEGEEALAFAATAGGGGEGLSSLARLDSCASSSSSSSFVSISTESPPSLLALYGEGYRDRIAEALSDAASST